MKNDPQSSLSNPNLTMSNPGSEALQNDLQQMRAGAVEQKLKAVSDEQARLLADLQSVQYPPATSPSGSLEERGVQTDDCLNVHLQTLRQLRQATSGIKGLAQASQKEDLGVMVVIADILSLLERRITNSDLNIGNSRRQAHWWHAM